jgi:HEPN domain-containing protein
MKLFSEKLSFEEQRDLVQKKTYSIVKACQPVKVLLIGSASHALMTTASDVDFVVILDEKKDLKKTNRDLVLSRNQDPWPQDVILITEENFSERSKIGGIHFIAASEGIEVFPRFEMTEKNSSPKRVQEKKFPKKYSLELLRIAEEYWKSALALNKAKGIRKENLFYLAEQSIEKSLKAVLCHLELAIPLVHGLGIFISKFPDDMDIPFGYELDELSQFATVRRYEEGRMEISEEEKNAVLKTSKEILEWAKTQIKK